MSKELSLVLLIYGFFVLLFYFTTMLTLHMHLGFVSEDDELRRSMMVDEAAFKILLSVFAPILPIGLVLGLFYVVYLRISEHIRSK